MQTTTITNSASRMVLLLLALLYSNGCRRDADTPAKPPDASAARAQKEKAARAAEAARKEREAAERRCAEGQGCLLAGRCSLTGQRCVAASDADCGGSRACKDQGVCTARAGACHKACDKEGWCTIFELDKESVGGGSWLGSMWASGPNDIFAVGRYTIAHYDGFRWQLQGNHATSAIYGIDGSGPTDVYTVGSWRTFQRYDGKKWHLEHKDTFGTVRTTHVDDVKVFAPGKACAASHSGRFWCRNVDGKWERIRSRKRRAELKKAFEPRNAVEKKPSPKQAAACAPAKVSGFQWCNPPTHSLVRCEDERTFVVQDSSTPIALGGVPDGIKHFNFHCTVTGGWIYATTRARVLRHAVTP